jgi:hypothetical protein
MDPLVILDAHGTYLSTSDEREILRRLELGQDVADLALRTCLCGVHLDGFDEYHNHLRRVLGPTPSAQPDRA